MEKIPAPQQELFKAETTWFHVFRTMIENGDVAKMGPQAFTVYCVIKGHTNFSTGHAFPSIETISQKGGLSDTQVKRELKTLQAMGYITKQKRGRNNDYTLREKVDIADESGRPAAVATWDYLPNSVQAAVADLKNVLVTGEIANARIVHIERLTVNVNTGNGTQFNIDMSAIKDGELKESLMALLASAKKDGSIVQD